MLSEFWILTLGTFIHSFAPEALTSQKKTNDLITESYLPNQSSTSPAELEVITRKMN